MHWMSTCSQALLPSSRKLKMYWEKKKDANTSKKVNKNGDKGVNAESGPRSFLFKQNQN